MLTPNETTSKRTNGSRWSWWWMTIIAIVLGVIAGQFALHLLAETFWFRELGYLNVFQVRIGSRAGLFAFASCVSAVLLFGNLKQAEWANTASNRVTSEQEAPQSQEFDRSRLAEYPVSQLNLSLNRRNPSPAVSHPHLPLTRGFRLWMLLPLTLGLSSALLIIVFYHGQIAFQHWHLHLSDYQQSSSVPSNIGITAILELLNTLRRIPIIIGIGILISVVTLFYARWVVRAIAAAMSLGFGIAIAEQWPRVLLALHPVRFDEADPLLQRDLSFYLFQLPVWKLLSYWAIGLSTTALLSALLLYLLSNNSLSRGRFLGFTLAHLRHLCGIGSGCMGAIALMYWLRRYELLYSSRGVAYGASYTDVMVQLPAYTALSILAIVFSAALLSYALVVNVRPRRQADSPSSSAPRPDPIVSTSPVTTIVVRDPVKDPSPAGTLTEKSSSIGLETKQFERLAEQRRVPAVTKGASLRPLSSPSKVPLWLFASVVAYWAIAMLASTALPALVQRTVVQPNELQLETPFIERSIALTREALSLDTIETETFDPQSSLTAADLQDNPLTIGNIRLWDSRPLLETNRQLQRIRLYYEFPDADVDRYNITSYNGDVERRQVLISARELNYADLSEDAKTWVNEHLIYTHGYGFTMSPVNTAGDDGLPDYFISGIDHIASTDAIRRSIPVNKPRIYYGELTDTYVMTQTQVRELDFPSGNENEYNTYDGNGGISIAPFWRRMIFAYHLRDWRMLLNRAFTPETRLLYRRNIKDRIQAIAPFLQFDSDPYLVIADITADAEASNDPDQDRTNQTSDRLLATPTQTPPNTLYWMIDAYTTSKYFPYADPIDRDFNYIRNSVKVVVDAYNGTVVFYVADETDPIIQSWEQTFPDLFLPLSAMPESLHEHIRYPQDYYQAQSQHLLIYHMTDPQVFYNREDEWRAPSEIYANEQQVVEPYYLTMKLPVGTSEEFILFRPFTPIQRRNLIAWLAARSDGDRYGTQLLYTFPKQDLVFGPEQVEARINQDPVISQQISLWNRAGSRAVQGNLLVIPIEQSLLYVEPLYLEAEKNRLPTLARVIVVFDNQIAMAPTLEEALNAVFQSDSNDVETNNTESTIVRPVDSAAVEPLNGPNLVAPDLSGELTENGASGVEGSE
ncbi:MAG: UPF0182 family protein [Cyanobacteria bacterium J06633_2]